METARILVFGNVQGVGFRAYAKQIARNMQILGFARNLDDGSVEIYAQAQKPEIESFVERITIQGNPSDPLSLHVARIAIAFEHNKDFKKQGRKLKAFEIDYGKTLKIEAKETIEKAEIATLMMHSLRGDTNAFRKETSENFTTLRSETNQNFKNLSTEINANFTTLRSETKENFNGLRSENNNNLSNLRSETNGNFSKLDDKYGSVSSVLNEINNNIKSVGSSIKQMSESIMQNNIWLEKIARYFKADA